VTTLNFTAGKPGAARNPQEGGADAVFDKSTELDQFLAYCARPH
jgi:hypothetical protein